MRQRRVVALLMFVVISALVVFGDDIREFWRVDRCLDSGGAWLRAEHRCVHN